MGKNDLIFEKKQRACLIEKFLFDIDFKMIRMIYKPVALRRCRELTAGTQERRFLQ